MTRSHIFPANRLLRLRCLCSGGLERAGGMKQFLRCDKTGNSSGKGAGWQVRRSESLKYILVRCPFMRDRGGRVPSGFGQTRAVCYDRRTPACALHARGAHRSSSLGARKPRAGRRLGRRRRVCRGVGVDAWGVLNRRFSCKNASSSSRFAHSARLMNRLRPLNLIPLSFSSTCGACSRATST